ncbi:MAG TPA: 3'-5' exonuclease [Azospirillaceae bacterium]|nr:3'-5' exonuclease [Azospirillaceae bacterium]
MNGPGSAGRVALDIHDGVAPAPRRDLVTGAGIDLQGRGQHRDFHVAGHGQPLRDEPRSHRLDETPAGPRLSRAGGGRLRRYVVGAGGRPREGERQRQPGQGATYGLAEGRERSSIDLIVRPAGYTIPPETSAIHGITNELALAVGVPHAYAASIFNAMCEQADVLVAHNLAYDLEVMEGLYRRLGKPHRLLLQDRRFCTKVWSTDIVGLPPTERMKAAGRHHFKAPTLTECMAFFFGEELQGAHNALVDARACGRVYFELMRLRREREEREAAEKARRRAERAKSATI